MRTKASLYMIFLVIMLAVPLSVLAEEAQADGDTGTMNDIILGNRIPFMYFVTSGHNDTDIGPGDDHWETGSYDLALMAAGIENFNVLKYTSVLPPESVEISLSSAKENYFHHGAAIETIMSDLNGEQGDTLVTGVGRIWVRTANDVPVGGFAAEYKKRYNTTVPEEQARADAMDALHTSLMGEVNRRYDASAYIFSEPNCTIDYLQVQKKYGTSLVALCWVNYIFPQFEVAGNTSEEE